MIKVVLIAATGALLLEGIITQLQQEPPSDLVALQWAIIVALVGVVGILYRTNNQLHDKHDTQLTAIREGYHKIATENTAAIKEISRAMVDMASLSKLEDKLARLEDYLEKSNR